MAEEVATAHRCPHCGEQKPAGMFPPSAKYSTPGKQLCRACMRKYQEERRAKLKLKTPTPLTEGEQRELQAIRCLSKYGYDAGYPLCTTVAQELGGSVYLEVLLQMTRDGLAEIVGRNTPQEKIRLTRRGWGKMKSMKHRGL